MEAYLESSVPCGESCVSETRTCDDGELSGSYTHHTCSPASQICSPNSIRCNGNDVEHCSSNGCEWLFVETCALDNAEAGCTGNGNCVVVSCNEGWDSCDNNHGTGCETSLNSTANCGACGAVCEIANGTGSCDAGTCVIGSCDPGFSTEDGNPNTGCECEVPFNNIQNLNLQEKSVLLPSNGIHTSQYSPYVLHRPGWGTILVYHCKLTPGDPNEVDIANGWEGPIGRDRVWRAEFDLDWNLIDHRMVIDGYLGQQDDLVCSSGVVIDGDTGVWHLYAVVADRDDSMNLSLYHYVATDGIGVTWQKVGPVGGLTSLPTRTYIETPTVYREGGTTALILPYGNGVYTAESSDGYTFSNLAPISNLPRSHSGTMSRYQNDYVWAYARASAGSGPPDEIAYYHSLDGMNNFLFKGILLEATGVLGGWDSEMIETPFFFMRGNDLFLLYAGSTGEGEHFTADTSIGIVRYSFSSTCGF